MGSMDLKNKFLRLREDFPMLKKTMHGKPLIYLDTAATAQKPNQVIKAIFDFYTDHYGTVHRAVYELAIHSTETYMQTREKIRRFLNAEKSEEIIYTRGTTESINMVAYSFGKAFVQPGDEILITEMEHHSNLVPWQILCEDRKAKLKVAPVNDEGELVLDELQALLSKKTKMVAVGHVSNVLGTINPVKEIIHMAHSVGAKVLVDGAQAAPHMRIDVKDLDADFYVFSGHKIYGPTGIGILYGKAELLDAMPPYQGGGDMIQKVTFPETIYNVLPMKFEAGTPMIAEVMGLAAAIDYLENIGIEDIFIYEQGLLHYAEERIKEIPDVRVIGTAQKKEGIISFIVKNVHPLDIGTMLDLKGIAVRTGHHCAQPAMRRFGVEGTTRLSLGLYNTREDIDHFIASLKEVIRLF
jgi:cysteine desulfurase/selenocysteine lyase